MTSVPEYEYLSDTPTTGGWATFLSCLAAEVDYLAAGETVPRTFRVAVDSWGAGTVRYLLDLDDLVRATRYLGIAARVAALELQVECWSMYGVDLLPEATVLGRIAALEEELAALEESRRENEATIAREV